MRLHFLLRLFSLFLLTFQEVVGGTLSPPHSPVKVLAAVGIRGEQEENKLRYYSFGDGGDWGNRKHADYASKDPFSKDPFEVPSLSVIAEMMRRRGGVEEEDTGWGWERGRQKEPPPPRPPPQRPPGWGSSSAPWEDDDDRRRPSGKGSYSPVVGRPWSGGPGWSNQEQGTQRPKYKPMYLASDEEKYRPIRYPSSSQAWERPSDNRPKEQGPGPLYLPPKRDPLPPPPRPSPPISSGPGPYYLPPHKEQPPRAPPLRDPPKWPLFNNDDRYDGISGRDRDRDRGGGWSPSRWDPTPTPRPPHVVPPPRQTVWDPDHSSNYRPPSWSTTTGGWNQDQSPPAPPPRPLPPPTTTSSHSKWGWRGGEHNSNKPTNGRSSPFEYKSGEDDLSKNLGPPVEIYEKEEYPPGIRRKVEGDGSGEDDAYPRAPNHYRITSQTPSPEEVHKILYQRPAPQVISYVPEREEEEDNFRGGCGGSKKSIGGRVSCGSGSSSGWSKPPEDYQGGSQKTKAEPEVVGGGFGSKISSSPRLGKSTGYDAQGFKLSSPYDEVVSSSAPVPIKSPVPPHGKTAASPTPPADARQGDSFKRAVAPGGNALIGGARLSFRRWNNTNGGLNQPNPPVAAGVKEKEGNERGARTKKIFGGGNRSLGLRRGMSTTTPNTTKLPEDFQESTRVADFGQRIKNLRGIRREGGFTPGVGPYGGRGNKFIRTTTPKGQNVEMVGTSTALTSLSPPTPTNPSTTADESLQTMAAAQGEKDLQQIPPTQP